MKGTTSMTAELPQANRGQVLDGMNIL